MPHYDSAFTAVFTNRPIVTPVRGAGRQHGVFVMERLLDIAARELGLDRVAIRRKNLIPADAFPYDHQILFQDFRPLTYDSGNYQEALDKAVALVGYDDFIRTEQPRARREGRHVGLGIVNYIEGTGIGPYEGARVTVERNVETALRAWLNDPRAPRAALVTGSFYLVGGAPARSPAAGRWWPATPFMRRR